MKFKSIGAAMALSLVAMTGAQAHTSVQAVNGYAAHAPSSSATYTSRQDGVRHSAPMQLHRHGNAAPHSHSYFESHAVRAQELRDAEIARKLELKRQQLARAERKLERRQQRQFERQEQRERELRQQRRYEERTQLRDGSWIIVRP